jgi:coenzyme F420-reducing hydrogenase delta subunit
MEINKQEQKKSTTNKLLVLIIAVLTVFCGILVWQYIELTKAVKVEVAEKVEVTEEKDALSQELENMLMEYENLQSDNGTLQAEMDQQKEKIEELLKEVAKHKGNTNLMVKYKKETETLRKIMHNYVQTIDSLNTANKMLQNENMQVKGELSAKNMKYNELDQERSKLAERVENASILHALNIQASGILAKSSGKETETNRAKKSEKIKVCFTLGENKIAPKGERTVFVRILSPEGKVLAEGADDSYMFTFDGVRGLYSAKRVVEYQNELITGCAYFTVKSGEILPEGKYIAEIYADKAKIGTTSFDLK